MIKQELLSTLNTLETINQASAEGYQSASTQVPQEDVARLFRLLAAERTEFSIDLQQVILKESGQVETQPLIQIAADLHQGWIDLRSSLQSGTLEAVLAEVERGEAFAKQRYEDALSMDFPPHIKLILTRHLTKISEVSNRIVSLKQVTA